MLPSEQQRELTRRKQELLVTLVNHSACFNDIYADALVRYHQRHREENDKTLNLINT